MNLLEKLAADPRVTVRRSGPANPDGTCIVYWMQRAQRGTDNPALDVAVNAGNLLGKPVVVFFAPVPFYPHANLRHYVFLNQGIPCVAEALEKRNVGFVLRRYPEHGLVKFCDEVKPALVIGDENSLREPEHWREVAARKLKVPLWTVDADVVVPSKVLEKAQYAAHIIRPRLQKQLAQFLKASNNPQAKVSWRKPPGLQALPPQTDITAGWKVDRSVQPIADFVGGAVQARRVLREFITRKLSRYAKERNHPEDEGTSRLSAYLHFGHISPITVALAVREADAAEADKNAFLDQLLTWRELAVNFVKFNPVYDTFECAEPWAHKTLAKHAKDSRPVIYNERQLEDAETYDPLWNAGQMQMVNTGWMHNYMRMYWGKKILEWSRSAAEAYQIAIRLNDKYEMDGRDPNGYMGVAWSIVGKFDRPWFERPIFGQIRYMSLDSTGKKFDSKKYIGQQTTAKLFP